MSRLGDSMSFRANGRETKINLRKLEELEKCSLKCEEIVTLMIESSRKSFNDSCEYLEIFGLEINFYFFIISPKKCNKK